ncbi:hypothetical protein Aple_099980 [Acrocarpospora pleiomorpha]|uniref:RloB domain-containing protein n=1 Tax=Acrocarpospora pleiomorpha TaxID=90975 RepID=A0A5M3Y3Z5_9ACTN|nr:RloB family protein [Acrocarpospora pleiomorpha]GES27099.1 hypothetical protein Aple_099980 [Acrocarpospora pleiomorpha]
MARKKGKEELGPSKRQRARRRRLVYVYSEGQVTEPTYIEIVRAQGVYADPTIAVEVRIANATVAGSRRKPIKLVEAAARLMREQIREAKQGGLTEEFWPQVWCPFDRDDHEQVDEAFKLAREADVRVAFSHPCFEVWRLLHFKPVPGTFSGVCGLVTDRLPFAKAVENVKLVLPEQIPVGSFGEAKKRAEQMNAAHGDHVPWSRRDPYTDVHTFVEQGLGIRSY